MRIIDFHTHAFPDKIAERAMQSLAENSGVEPTTNGTLRGLLDIMDRDGVEKAVLLNIATKVSQNETIISWCREIASDRIIPFASIHPDTPDIGQAVERVRAAGIAGIKMHPLYQEFKVDDRRVFPFYEAVESTGLILLMHAGYDIAFERQDEASPERFARVIRQYPGMRLVLAHMGGWNWYDEVVRHLAGSNVWIDTSFALGFCSDEQLNAILSAHSADRIVFGTDTPWASITDQADYIERWPVSDEDKEKIFHANAEALLRKE